MMVSRQNPSQSPTVSSKVVSLPDTVQLDVLCYADRCIQRLRRWHQDQTEVGREAVHLKRLQVVTKVKETCTVIRDFLFADDTQCALNARSEQEMQLEMDRFSTACDNVGLTMMLKPAPSIPYHDPIITVEDQKL